MKERCNLYFLSILEVCILVETVHKIIARRGRIWGKKWKFAWGNILGGEMEYYELTAANRIEGGRMMKRRHNRQGRIMIMWRRRGEWKVELKWKEGDRSVLCMDWGRRSRGWEWKRARGERMMNKRVGGNVSVDGIWIRNESGISTRKWWLLIMEVREMKNEYIIARKELWEEIIESVWFCVEMSDIVCFLVDNGNTTNEQETTTINWDLLW